MSKTDDQIAELRAEVARLEQEINALHAAVSSVTIPPVRPPTKPHIEGEVRVTFPSAHNPAFTMPSEAQLRELLAIVVRRYPILLAGIKPGRFASQDEADFFNEYEAAFRALGTVNRTPDGVDEKHGADHWVRIIQDRVQGGSQTLHLLPVTAAIVASTDIPFMLCEAAMMNCSFGLRGDDVGPAATDRWRHTLATNMARESLPLPRHRAWSMGMSSAGM